MEAEMILCTLTLGVGIKHRGTCFGELGGKKQVAARSARGPGERLSTITVSLSCLSGMLP